MRIFVRIVFISFLCLAVMAGGFFFWFYTGVGLPRLEDLENHQLDQTSKIIAADGSIITELHGEQNRENVSLDQICPDLQNAVIAIEDERFYQHGGVDWKAIARAFWTNVVQGEVVQGASTITQQYVDIALAGRERTYWRKIEEARLANQLERKFSKDKILEMYLNEVYFGQGCYGVKTASQTFFGKQPSELGLDEAALLAAIIRIPNYYSPYLNVEAARDRRNVVLDKMEELGFITYAQAAEAKSKDLVVQPIPEEAPSPTAPYFVEYVKQYLYNVFAADPDLRAKFGDLSPDDIIFRGGLRVHTTIDLNLQKYAEDAINSTLNQEGDPSAALCAVDPRSGEIKAMVGGKDYSELQYNIAAQGGRQPGSSFKGFVLTTAISNGISPYKSYDSSPTTLEFPDGTKWKVGNAEGSSYGTINVYSATVRSVNVVYARIIRDVGTQRVIQMAQAMGITSEIPPYPSIALGTNEVNPLEMASAYGTLANNGVHVPPICVTKVTDAEGNIIFENTPKGQRVVREDVAAVVNSILQDAVRYGTGRAARIDRPQAGKTGTTDDYADAWFCGYTPDLSAAVWVGYSEGRIPMRSVHGITVYGGTFPAQIWRKFMENALVDVPASAFPEAEFAGEEDESEWVTLTICSDSGLRATPFCPHTETKTFRRGEEPSGTCTIHNTQTQKVNVPAVTGLTEAGASAAIRGAGLNPAVNYAYSSAAPQGTVINQSPLAGTSVNIGSTVSITVSQGAAPQASVPNVVGMGETAAKETLSAGGFTYKVVYSPTDASQVGIVISQFPGGGASAGPGSQVIITVGKAAT
ncbi:MAG: PBP1A family penicillin-binding protein [Actinobacteria bacterium]|jgi:penicillin-binding protein 1A|nr:MAG: PBP1A family penicillin-binding protein [Actinomycetota bacterium]